MTSKQKTPLEKAKSGSATKAESGTRSRTDGTIDAKIIKALGHPLRQRVLQVLNVRVASPSEIAEELGEPLSNVSYHVKILIACDAIELVRTAPVRGALEHFYRAMMRPRLEAEHWAVLPESSRIALLEQTLGQALDKVAASASADGFKDLDTTVVWSDFELDRQGMQEITEELSSLLDRVLDLQAEAMTRLAALDEAERKEQELHTTLALLHFPKP